MAESFASSSTWTGPARPPTAPAPSDSPPSDDPHVLRVAFKTLGCKVNRVESESIAAELLGRGVTLAEESHAGLIVINTCTVTAEADRKARKAVRHALSLAHEPVVLVTGCLASVDPLALEALSERVVVEPVKDRVADRVAESLGVRAGGHVPTIRSGEGFRTRAMLKVEDGCDNACSYCIVPLARGVPRSVPASQVLEEARALVAAGVAELVLTGINIGRYRDKDSGMDLAGLIGAVAGTGVPRIRVSSIEPPDLTGEFLEVVSALPTFCRHLHVPLQSGSDAVLDRMNRGYTAARYEERIAAATAALPGLAVTTDVIVGFPGETQADVDETLALLGRVGFSRLHVFRYSPRPSTPAAGMSDQVESGTSATRAAMVRLEGEALRDRWLEGLTGRVVEVLVEELPWAGVALGTSREYARVRAAVPAGVSQGDLVAVLGEAVDDGILLGSACTGPGGNE